MIGAVIVHLYKQKESKYWWVKFYDPDGKPVYKSTRTTLKKEARRKAEDIAAGMRREAAKEVGLGVAFQDVVRRAADYAAEGSLSLSKAEDLIRRLHRIANPDYCRVTLQEHVDAFLAAKIPQLPTESSRNSYRTGCQKMLEALGKKTAQGPVDGLTGALVVAAAGKMRKGMKGATANLYVKMFRYAMEQAVDEGLIPTNPAGEKVIKPFQENDSEQVAAFTQEEFNLLLEAAAKKHKSDEWAGLILIAGHTGQRLGDCLELGTASIRNDSFVFVQGKKKAAKKTVRVPITSRVLEWIDERQGKFFPTLKKQATSSTSSQFASIMKEAGVPKYVETPEGGQAKRTFHSLRHSFTSWLADAAVAPDIRKKLTGHSKDGIHARYTHHDQSLNEAVQKLPQ